MSNIIEKRIKLNMKTETKEERTLKLPNGGGWHAARPSSSLGMHGKGPLLLHKVAQSLLSVVEWMCCG